MIKKFDQGLRSVEGMNLYKCAPHPIKFRPAWMEDRSKSEQKRTRKMMPKSTKKWSQDPLGAPQIAYKSSSIHSGRSKGVPGASRDVSAAPRERPKGVPGEARDAFGEPEKAIRRQSSTILDRNVVQFRRFLVEIRRIRSNIRSGQGMQANFVKC